MLNRLRARVDAGQQDGFTLIELLIVIVILGVLAGIVVFAVGGITDRGEDSACESDYKTIQVAQEASFAQTGAYQDEGALETANFLASQSDLYDTAATGTPAGSDYEITSAGDCPENP